MGSVGWCSGPAGRHDGRNRHHRHDGRGRRSRHHRNHGRSRHHRHDGRSRHHRNHGRSRHHRHDGRERHSSCHRRTGQHHRHCGHRRCGTERGKLLQARRTAGRQWSGLRTSTERKRGAAAQPRAGSYCNAASINKPQRQLRSFLPKPPANTAAMGNRIGAPNPCLDQDVLVAEPIRRTSRVVIQNFPNSDLVT